MKTFTIKTIRSFKPCYDPKKYLSEAWSGNVIDLLDIKEIPFRDRLWVILRSECLSNKLMRLFAVWSARQVQPLMNDPRAVHVLDVAEAFANGTATMDELADARNFAYGAAAYDIFLAHDTCDVARACSVHAAGHAAYDVAIRDADGTDVDTYDVVYTRTQDAQYVQLRKMILDGQETGDTL